MSEADVLEENVAALSHPFVKQIVMQLRAVDSYGTYDTWSDEKVLEPMILTKERRREIPIVGDPDEVTISRVKAYYNGLAQMIEQQTGLMAVPVINLTHEGFGRAFITVGRLIVLDKTLRDVHRFGFTTTDKLINDSQGLIDKAVAMVSQHRAVADL